MNRRSKYDRPYVPLWRQVIDRWDPEKQERWRKRTVELVDQGMSEDAAGRKAWDELAAGAK